jgi:hypothetical protein
VQITADYCRFGSKAVEVVSGVTCLVKGWIIMAILISIKLHKIKSSISRSKCPHASGVTEFEVSKNRGELTPTRGNGGQWSSKSVRFSAI